MAGEAPSVHASAVLASARAVLIRGPAGSGKSRLALAIIEAAQTGLLPIARLVGDDRVHLEPCYGRLLVRPAPAPSSHRGQPHGETRAEDVFAVAVR